MQLSAQPAVIAHRGASRAAPENTLEAFLLAGRLGAEAVELDVRRTADATLAVHHDAHLPDGRPLAALSRSELPASVPDLGAALDASTGMWVNVELKNAPGEPDFDPDQGIASAVVELVTTRGDEGRVLVSSFDLPTVDRVREASGGRVRTAFLVVVADADAIRTTVEHGHHAIHPFFAGLDAELVAAALAAGLDVNPWTCDDPAWMLRLAGWGVTGICTNVPDLALQTLAAQR